MWTDAVERMEFTVHIEDRDDTPANDHLSAGSRRNFAYAGHLNTFGHSHVPQNTQWYSSRASSTANRENIIDDVQAQFELHRQNRPVESPFIIQLVTVGIGSSTDFEPFWWSGKHTQTDGFSLVNPLTQQMSTEIVIVVERQRLPL